MPVTYKLMSAGAIMALSMAIACNFSPTSPFEGFDGMGSRVAGQFASDGATESSLRAYPQSAYEGMTVSVKQNPSIQTSVRSNGTFTLEGIPDGRVTLVFKTDVRVNGEITLEDVRPNQEIRIVVELTVDLTVVLVSEQRDQVDFSVSCARSPSFWCKASRGNSSTLGEQEFRELAQEAAGMLSGIPELDSPEGVADAVCNKSTDRDRFLRELVALALNLTAGLDRAAPLEDGQQAATIGAAFDGAVDIAQGNPTPGAMDAFEELIEGINDNENTSIAGCVDDDTSEDKKSEDSKSDDSVSEGSGSSGG